MYFQYSFTLKILQAKQYVNLLKLPTPMWCVEP